MKREHSKSYINFNEILQRTGKTPIISSFERSALIRSPMEDDDGMTPEAKARTLSFIFSTGGIKRDGNEIVQAGWRFDNLRANPRFLWCHESREAPIGNIVEVGLKRKKALGTCATGRVYFFNEDEFIGRAGCGKDFADRVLRAYKADHMNATSISWKTLKYEWIKDEEGYYMGVRFLENDALEVSAVPIPADPNALKNCSDFGFRAEELVMKVRTQTPEGEPIFNLDAAQPERTASVIVDFGNFTQVETITDEDDPEERTEATVESEVGTSTAIEPVDSVDPPVDGEHADLAEPRAEAPAVDQVVTTPEYITEIRNELADLKAILQTLTDTLARKTEPETVVVPQAPEVAAENSAQDLLEVDTECYNRLMGILDGFREDNHDAEQAILDRLDRLKKELADNK